MMRIIVLSIFMFSQALTSSAQVTKVKASFLYNFTKYISWPEEKGKQEFVITVLGDKELGLILNDLAKKNKIQGKPLVVKTANQIKDIGNSDMVYIGATKGGYTESVNSMLRNEPVLIVCDKPGYCKKGAGICFTTIGGKLRYEINSGNIEKKGLSVSNKLLSLGIKK